MAGVLEGKILESFLKPLKGKYNGSATAEWDIVLRRSNDTLLDPERSVLKLVTLGGEQFKQFCLTTVLGGKIGGLYEMSPEKLGALTALQNRGLRKVVLVGVGAKFSPEGWHELVYARTSSEEFDLRASFLETLAKYNGMHPKP